LAVLVDAAHTMRAPHWRGGFELSGEGAWRRDNGDRHCWILVEHVPCIDVAKPETGDRQLMRERRYCSKYTFAAMHIWHTFMRAERAGGESSVLAFYQTLDGAGPLTK